MSLWNRITKLISDLGNNLPLIDLFRGPPENSVTFTISIIALSAKMAKADGTVTRDEVRALRQIFQFNSQDEDDIARVFDLARKDVAGYREYATKIRKLFVGRPEMLDEIFESLFQIAIADGEFHENEDAFLTEVAEIFQTRKYFYDELKARYIPGSKPSPLQVLGVADNATHDEIKAAYRAIVRENHPDAMRARGMPDEAIVLAENRIRCANEAYETFGIK